MADIFTSFSATFCHLYSTPREVDIRERFQLLTFMASCLQPASILWKSLKIVLQHCHTTFIESPVFFKFYITNEIITKNQHCHGNFGLLWRILSQPQGAPPRNATTLISSSSRMLQRRLFLDQKGMIDSGDTSGISPRFTWNFVLKCSLLKNS